MHQRRCACPGYSKSSASSSCTRESGRSTEESGDDWPKTVTVQSPDGAFLSIYVYEEGSVNLRDLVREAVDAMRVEYEDLEAEESCSLTTPTTVTTSISITSTWSSPRTFAVRCCRDWPLSGSRRPKPASSTSAPGVQGDHDQPAASYRRRAQASQSVALEPRRLQALTLLARIVRTRDLHLHLGRLPRR